MAFVNEYIPQEDFEKYDFKSINNRWNGGGNPSRDWTVDRERNIWLRCFYRQNDHTEPDGGYTGKKIWDFYWKGTLMSVETQSSNEKGTGIGEHFSYHLKVLSINIPDFLHDQRDEIFHDLYCAFITYSGGGIFSESLSCSICFEISGELL